jgi:ubiquinone/menaquinone biosynthesis C-methylase UbiE
MSEADEVREQQRRTWDRFSRGWEKWDDLVVPMLQPVGDEMLRLLRVPDDAHHLDVASGTGEPGLTIAMQTPNGSVVLTDPAAGMIEVATRNARARGLDNVEFHVCGADELPFADAAFDSISCRFGFMFFPDIARAVGELRRVLRPGGRLCTAVWAQPEGNPWATIPMAAIATETELPATPADAPGLFRCAAPGAISDLFAAAGFRDVGETDVRASLATTSSEEYWQYMTEVAAPVIAGLSVLDEAARARARSAAMDEAEAFEVDGQLRLPLHARCVIGTR